MKKFHEMLAKKRDMKPSEKHAKMGVLKDLKDSLADSMGDKLDGMKKVSVMSNSPEGLDAGLDKAKMLSHQMPPDMDQDESAMSEGGISMNTDPNESEHVTYDGTPHDDGFMAPNENEAYSTGMSMDNDNESKQDPDEPEHVSYDGSSDEKMGPGYYEGGEMGPNEAMPDEVTYSGSPDDDGFMHPDSDQAMHGASYSKGGKVKKSPMDEAADSVQEERDETMADEGDDLDDEHSMDAQKLQAKIDHLMRLKKQMEQQ